MKHILLMVIGCALALLLIFFLPAMGLGSGWVAAMVIGAMMLCHLMHFGMRVYVSLRDDNAVAQTLTTDRGAHGFAVDDGGSRVFIEHTLASTVSTIDAATQCLTGAVRVCSGPSGINYRPASR